MYLIISDYKNVKRKMAPKFIKVLTNDIIPFKSLYKERCLFIIRFFENNIRFFENNIRFFEKKHKIFENNIRFFENNIRFFDNNIRFFRITLDLFF